MGSLPNKQFICNYNAKLFDAATNTIPNTDGALFNSGLTLNRAPDVVGDGYIALNTAGNSTRCDYTFSSNADNPFLRTGSDAITIVAKVNAITNQGNSYQCLLSCRNGNAVNYGIYTRSNDFGTDLAFPTRYGASRSNTAYIASPTYPNIFEFTVSNGTSMGYSYTDETASTVQQFSWTGANNHFTFFGVYGNSNEDWSGEFHWVYISPEALTDAEIRQVIDYNENLSTGMSVSPANAEFSKLGETKAFEVNSEYQWNADTEASWLTLSTSQGSPYEGLNIIASKNNTNAPRSAVVSFSNENSDIFEVNITQPNIVTEISLDNFRNGSSYVNKMYIGSTYVYKRFGLNNIILNIQDAIDMSSDGETVSVPVSSNASWTAATTDAWITITNPTGSGDGSFSVTAAAAESGRAGNITVTAEKGGFTTVKTIEVTQMVIPIPQQNEFIYLTNNGEVVTPFLKRPQEYTPLVSTYQSYGRMVFSNNVFNTLVLEQIFSGTHSPVCQNITAIYLYSGITQIDYAAFENLPNLTEIYSYNPTAPTLDGQLSSYPTFSGINPTGTLHIPSGSTASYQSWFANNKNLGAQGFNWTVVEDL